MVSSSQFLSLKKKKTIGDSEVKSTGYSHEFVSQLTAILYSGSKGCGDFSCTKHTPGVRT